MNLTTFAQYYNRPMMDGRDGGRGAGMMLFCIVIFIFFALWFVYAFRGHGHHESMSTPTETPLDIAKKRYAAGEITKAEFEVIKKDLA